MRLPTARRNAFAVGDLLELCNQLPVTRQVVAGEARQMSAEVTCRGRLRS
jgi:hypothetical protein